MLIQDITFSHVGVKSEISQDENSQVVELFVVNLYKL